MRLIYMSLAALFVCAIASDERKIICYFGSWSVYRIGNGKFDISNIDPSLCTHLVYTFVGITPDGDVKVIDPHADLPDNYGKNGFGRFNQLRKISPGAKTLVAIGGWKEGSIKYSQVASNEKTRETFIENAVAFVKKYYFDGLDFDWEYPNQRGGVPEDRENFVLLLKQMRQRFDQEGLILSAAVAATKYSASKSYNIAGVTKYLHFVSIMAYDLHGAWDEKTGVNAPLYPGSWEQGEDRLLNVNASVHYWISEGAPREKIVVGIPMYGRSFTLQNAQNNGIGAPASAGSAGTYTQEAGYLGYNEICESQKNGGWEIHFQEEQRVPYTIKENQWIGYENIKSIQEKAEYIKNLGLGGAMVWSIETDDFNGICGPKYPLLNTLNYALRGDPALNTSPTFEPITSTSPKPTDVPTKTTSITRPSTAAKTTTTLRTTTSTLSGPCDLTCKEEGYLRDGNDCAVFYQCVKSGNGYTRYKFACSTGTVFDLENLVCNWPNAVDCSTCK